MCMLQDPLGFTKDKDEDGYWRLAHGEIKNGRRECKHE